jgi:APA family basic amino acid/polyamine antiporter
VLYVGANIAYHAVLPMHEVAAAGEKAAHRAVEQLLGSAGGVIMALAIMCSTFGAMNSNLLIGPRVAFAMGRDRVFFSQLGRVHVTNQTPSVAIAVQAAMAIGLVLVSNYLIRYVPRFADESIFDMLTNFVIFGSSVFYALSAAAVIVLRIKHPEWPRPYRTWGYPFVPLFFVGFYAWFLWHVYWGEPDVARTGLYLILLGIPVYFIWRWRGAEMDAALPLVDDEPGATPAGNAS